jgi:hypothetical protein
MNSTYKAALQAGFNDKTFPRLSEVIFVTEPEAAAIYTARYLREDKRISFLKVRVLSVNVMQMPNVL